MTDFALSEDLPVTSTSSAVSWDAIAAGALTAVAVSLVLFSLGTGLGFAAASPWTLAKSAGAIGAAAGIWLVVVQWLASALGGYLTGRLRRRWAGTHSHEVFFRDTAHGFLAWAVATVLVAAVAAAISVGAAGKAAEDDRSTASALFAYDADTLYRSPVGDLTASTAAREEAAQILAASAAKGGISDADRGYLATSAVSRAGINATEARARVDALVARQDQAAKDAGKTAAALAILTALSLMVGAFIASVAGALGGQERDKHP